MTSALPKPEMKSLAWLYLTSQQDLTQQSLLTKSGFFSSTSTLPHSPGSLPLSLGDSSPLLQIPPHHNPLNEGSALGPLLPFTNTHILEELVPSRSLQALLTVMMQPHPVSPAQTAPPSSRLWIQLPTPQLHMNAQ